jgi:hypothetical protein
MIYSLSFDPANGVDDVSAILIEGSEDAKTVHSILCKNGYAVVIEKKIVFSDGSFEWEEVDRADSSGAY